MSDRENPTVVPPAGPLDELPLSAVTTVQARAMLDQAVTGLPVGEFDREIIEWLTGTDTRAVVVVASLLRRAWAAGTDAGRAEHLDEQPLVQHLRSTIAALEDDLRDRNARVAEIQAALDAARQIRQARPLDGAPTYLGDGLYASTDGFLVALTADLGSPIERTVYLEPQVMDAFARWVKDGAR